VFGIESIEPNAAIERLRALHDYALFPELFDAIADGVVVYYEPALREFTLPNVDGVSAYVLNYCPLTGARLPPSLRDEWYDALEAAGAFPVDEAPPVDFLAPPAYRSDAWWRDTELAKMDDETPLS
jgi:hypothetical protein